MRFAFAVLFLGACIPESDVAERKPEVVARVQASKFEPPPGCKALGEVCGYGDTYEAALRDLRGAAAEAGGDWVTIDGRSLPRGYDDEVQTVGRAFRCMPHPSSEQARFEAETCAME